MTSRGQKIARLAQVFFVVGVLILAFGFAHLFLFGGNPSSQAIDSHRPYLYAFEILIGASIILAIVAIVLNFRSNTK